MADNRDKNKEFEERVISVDRVARVVKGGRRIRFRALVVIGNKKGKVGAGVGKAGDVATAVLKAKEYANKHLHEVAIYNETIGHEISYKYGGVRLILKPAKPGHSIIAGGPVRAVVELAGIKNIVSKSLGSANKINMVRAALLALTSIKKPEKEVKHETAPVKTNA